MPNPKLRLHRFSRAAKPPPLQLTERDIEIIRQVFKHRFLNSQHIGLLVGGSKQNILRRLQRLYHKGYLERPRAKLDYFRPQANYPLIYGIGRRGAKALAERSGVSCSAVGGRSGNLRANRLFLEHSLMISDVMVKIEVACRRAEGICLIEEEKILENCSPETRKKRVPFSWHVRFPNNGVTQSLGIVPDKVFGLKRKGLEAEQNAAYFFLEADRGTMPVERAGNTGTSIFRKMLAYHESWKQELHRRHFGLSRFCVLFVSTTAARVGSMIEANRRFNSGNGSRQFLFADSTFLSSADPLSHPLKNGAGETLPLLDLIR